MKRGQFSEKETQLVKRVKNEFELFKYKMLSKSRKKIFERCDEIRFYSCICGYFVYAEDVGKGHIETCLRYERPIAELYRVYQEYEYLRYSRWEDIEDLLDVLVRKQEDRDKQKDPAS